MRIFFFGYLFLRLWVKVCQFLRLTAKCFSRFTAIGLPHRDPPKALENKRAQITIRE